MIGGKVQVLKGACFLVMNIVTCPGHFGNEEYVLLLLCCTYAIAEDMWSTMKLFKAGRGRGYW
jgi:hypothetical protein